MISVDLASLNVSFSRRRVFEGLSGQIVWPEDEGSIVGLMGASGSGKSTLARLILQDRYGERRPGLRVSGADVIGVVPQQPVLFEHLDVASNARLFAAVGRYRSRFDQQLFESLNETLRMGSLMAPGVSVRNLSGGEAQRVMLLRTLSMRPELLILDEPSAGLDASIRESFLSDLATTVARLKISVLYIGHHWNELAAICTQIVYLPTFESEAGLTVREIVVSLTQDFARAPPTPQAFEAVNGPGTGLWPVEPAMQHEGFRLISEAQVPAYPQWLAAFSPRGMGGLKNFIHARGFRIDPRDARGSEVRSALIYQSGRFLGSAGVVDANNG